MKVKTKKMKNPISLFSVCCFIVLTGYAICLLTLIAWGLIKSLQPLDDFLLAEYMFSGFPEKFTFDNYIDAFDAIKYNISPAKGGGTVYLPEMLLYSIMYSVGGGIMMVMTSCVVAYLTSKYRNKFNMVVDGMFYFALLFPIVGSTPSTIQVTTKLGLIDTWIGMFIMKMNFLGTAYLIFKATFKTLDNGYAEAAKIDGASQFTIMVSIIFPLIKTTITILFVIDFIALWNDYQAPMIYLNSYPTAAYGMYWFNISTNSANDMPIYKMAGFMILIIPTFTIFMFMKDKMMGNLTIGGLKG